MDLAQLTEWVTLQRPSGVAAEGFDNVIRIPVALEMVDSGGVEALRFGVGTAIGYFKVTMRYRDDLKAEWRFLHDDGRKFQISSYGPLPRAARREATVVYVTEIQ